MLDPSLRGFVEAADEAEAGQRLAALLDEHAAPLVRTIVARRLAAYGGARESPEDVEDIVCDALLAMVSRLQALRADPGAAPIEDLSDYTAVVAYNAFAHHMRRNHPGRSRLKNRLRYVLRRESRFGLWQTPDGLCCGLAAWRPAPASPDAGGRLDRVRAEPERWLRWTRKGDASPDDLRALLDAVLRAVNGPVDFDRLVNAIAGLYPSSREARSAATFAELPDAVSAPADVALDRLRLTQRLWLEIGSLPLRQRAALLLSLRDERGGSVLWVFPLTAVASMRQIARALEMPDLELAELWNRLPLDDRTIAQRLGCNRQQVINLRSAARKRLSNRLNPSGAERGPSERGNTPEVSASVEDKA